MERCNCCHGGNGIVKNSILSCSTSDQLKLAIQSCNKAWMKSLLSFPDKNFHILNDKYMCLAATSGEASIVLEILAAGANPNENSLSCEKCPVHICAEHCHISCLEVLIDHGADVNQLDSHKRTAVHFAAQNGHKKAIKAIPMCCGQKTCLQLQNHELKVLTTGPCFCPNRSKVIPLAIFMWLVGHGALADEADLDGYTPLHLASCLGHKEICSFLLTVGGADVNSLNNDGWSPLHIAACYGYLEVVKLLLSFGAIIKRKTFDGENVLHLACAKGFSDISQVLLDHGASIEACNSHGATPLHYAVCNGHLRLAYKLLKSGANVNFLHLSGSSLSCPLNLAAMKGDQDMLNLLQCAGCIVHPHTAALLYNRQNISAQCREEISQFPSLRDMCVWKIRQALAPELQDKATFLPLPEVLKKCVTYQYLKIR